MTFIEAQRNLREKCATLGGRLLCLLGEHELTSHYEQGLRPTAEDVKPENVMDSFREFSALRCKRKGCKFKFTGDL